MDPPIVRIPCLKGSSAYEIVVGGGALEHLARDLQQGGRLGCGRHTVVVVVSDTTVWGHHGPRLCSSLAAVGIQPLVRLLAPGEVSKTRGVKEGIEDWMLSQQCLRDTVMVALGGGVVGDLTGYVASTYMRGVPVVHVPTTLLAMVDSSIGGKTGLDVPAGKNLVGAFHQPRGVYSDPTLLATLPQRELCNGMAEVIKSGAIAHGGLFEACERGVEGVLARDLGVLTTIILETSRVKAQVVTEDEREGGRRAILNWGHTVGHGIEALMQPRLLHGECVAIGMVKEAEVCRALGHCDSALVNRIKNVCKAYHLPVTVPGECSGGLGLEGVMEKMGVDKKNTREGGGGGEPTIKCVLVPSIGTVVSPPFAHPVPATLLRRLLSASVTVTQQQQQHQQQALPACATPPTTAPSTPTLTIRVPGSKSVSNRALLLAGLSRGTTRVSGLLASDDTQVMLSCLTDMGAQVRHEGGGVVHITGPDTFTLPPTSHVFYVQNAGTAQRFLTSVIPLLPFPPPTDAPAAAAAAATAAAHHTLVLKGNARMAVRPCGPLVDALRAQGVGIEYGGLQGCPPLNFTSGLSLHRDSDTPLTPTLPSGASSTSALVQRRRVVKLAAKVSSQYVSSILMASPYFPPVSVTPEELRAWEESRKGGDKGCVEDPTGGDVGYTELVLAEEFPTSLPYILMTITTMGEFGVQVIRLGSNRFLVPRTHYTSPGSYAIEADASSASYPATLAVLTGRRIVIQGVGFKSTQGDAGYPALLGRMGAVVEQGEWDTTLSPPPHGQPLKGIDVDMADQTDCFMTLAVAAAQAEGTTRITGIANQRVKECNRIAAMVTELGKLGVVTRELPEGIEIQGKGRALGAAEQQQHYSAPPPLIHCYDDHRIAMSFSLMAHTLPTGITLDDAACVEKTYPEYWDDLERIMGFMVVGGSAKVGDGGSSGSSGSSPRSVLVIGMRGAGKSGLAKAAVQLMGGGWQCVDLDRVLEAERGCSIKDMIATLGWEGFREAECELLERAVVKEGGCFSRRAIVACGGGIVETERARGVLSEWGALGGRVIEVVRDIKDIEEDLGMASPTTTTTTTTEDSGRPSYPGGVSFRDMFSRRVPWYRGCSTHTFAVLPGDREWGLISSRFTALVRAVAVPPTPSSSTSDPSHAPHTRTAPGKFGPLGIPVASWREMRETPGGVISQLTPGASSWPVSAPPPVSNSGVVEEGGSAASHSPSWLPAGVSDGSSFVCLAVPSLWSLLPNGATASPTHDFPALCDALHAICTGADAVELRVDALTPPLTPSLISHTLTLLRTAIQKGAVRALEEGGAGKRRVLPGLCSPPPIIFTVRSKGEGGGFNGSPQEYSALVLEGVRCGAEWVDIELGRALTAAASPSSGAGDAGGVNNLASSRRTLCDRVLSACGVGGSSRVLGSAHWPSPLPLPSQGTLLKAAMQSTPYCHALKLVVSSQHPSDTSLFLASVEHIRGVVGQGTPLIALAMGEAGKLSRVSNPFFTPVTHSLLPTMAAPGQLSQASIAALRGSLGMTRPRAFYLWGSPIAKSISPAIHNAAFRALGLPHTYGLCDTEALSVLSMGVVGGGRVQPTHPTSPSPSPSSSSSSSSSSSLTPHFPSFTGGGNVTIPLKQHAMAICNTISHHAAAIGGVNTLVVVPQSDGGRFVFGDNTDWLGLFWPLAQRLSSAPTLPPTSSSSSSSSPSPPYALVIGAGATARAACYAVMKLGVALLVYNPRTPEKGGEVGGCFGGRGVLDITPTHLPPYPPTIVINTLPSSLQWAPPTPTSTSLLFGPATIAMDVAYLPRDTLFLQSARQAGCYATIEGIEMLITQGVAAWALWMGKASHAGEGGGGVAEGPQGEGGVPFAHMAKAAYEALEGSDM